MQKPCTDLGARLLYNLQSLRYLGATGGGRRRKPDYLCTVASRRTPKEDVRLLAYGGFKERVGLSVHGGFQADVGGGGTDLDAILSGVKFPTVPLHVIKTKCLRPEMDGVPGT